MKNVKKAAPVAAEKKAAPPAAEKKAAAAAAEKKAPVEAAKKVAPVAKAAPVAVPNAALATNSSKKQEVKTDAKQLSKEKIEALEKLLAPLENNMGKMKEEHIKSVKADEQMSKTLRGTNNTAQGDQMEKFNGVFTHMYEK